MPTRYALAIDEAANDVLRALPYDENRALQDFLKGLASRPFQIGEQTVVDAAGRPNSVIGFDRFVITYWADHAVAQLRIVAIELF